jgi:hypothetical protein
MAASNEDQVKVRFELEQDEDGWPPVRSEGIWATPSETTSTNSTPSRGSRAELRTVIASVPGPSGSAIAAAKRFDNLSATS